MASVRSSVRLFVFYTWSLNGVRYISGRPRLSTDGLSRETAGALSDFRQSTGVQRSSSTTYSSCSSCRRRRCSSDMLVKCARCRRFETAGRLRCLRETQIVTVEIWTLKTQAYVQSACGSFHNYISRKLLEKISQATGVTIPRQLCRNLPSPFPLPSPSTSFCPPLLNGDPGYQPREICGIKDAHR